MIRSEGRLFKNNFVEKGKVPKLCYALTGFDECNQLEWRSTSAALALAARHGEDEVSSKDCIGKLKDHFVFGHL